MEIKEKAKQLKSDIPVVFLALKKKETPFYAKISAAITVGYALSPIDLIPDFIPLLGYLDDIILLPMLVALTIKLIPNEIIQQCRIETTDLWTNCKPQKWYYAIPIIVFWIFITYCIVKTLF